MKHWVEIEVTLSEEECRATEKLMDGRATVEKRALLFVEVTDVDKPKIEELRKAVNE